MTPDQARDLLAGTTPGPWEVDTESTVEASIWSPSVIVIGPYYDREDAERWETGTPEDLRLAAAAPALAAMIAGMREDWGVSWDDDPSDSSRDWGFATRAAAERWEKGNRRYGPGRGRAVRRYIIEPEDDK